LTNRDTRRIVRGTMDKPITFAEVVALWPSAADLARDLGVQEVTARAWKTRGAIPPAYWLEVEAAATARGISYVTVDLLAEIAARDGGRAEPSPEGAAA